jgi:site-specific DNA-methyltransferase (adenine-specific)
MSNKKMFRYEWIWEKSVPTGHLNANKMPMKWHEQIIVFYSQLPTYNPQLRKGIGYKVKLSDIHSENYGKQKNVGSSENDGNEYKPKDIIKFNNENGGGKLHPTQKPVGLFEYLIEKEQKYFDLATRRLDDERRQLSLL